MQGIYATWMNPARIRRALADLPAAPHTLQETPELRAWFDGLVAALEHDGHFQHSLAAARSFQPRTNKPAYSAPLFNSPEAKLSLLGLHPEKPVPLHDHPGGQGAQLVLSGRIGIRQFEACETQPASAGLRYLKRTANQRLGPRAISSVTREGRNIHALAAHEPGSVLLSLQSPALSSEQQNWYFPVADRAADNQPMLCNRLAGRRARLPR